MIASIDLALDFLASIAIFNMAIPYSASSGIGSPSARHAKLFPSAVEGQPRSWLYSRPRPGCARLPRGERGSDRESLHGGGGADRGRQNQPGQYSRRALQGARSARGGGAESVPEQLLRRSTKV